MWIVDHVVQMGQEKCLLIVGIRLSAVPAEGGYLTHADVEPIAICPVTQSNGEIVYQQLEAARKQTGVPREILSDQGSDLHKGIRQFCEAHPETCAVYDIKHKVAAVLKRELGAEPGVAGVLDPGDADHRPGAANGPGGAGAAPPTAQGAVYECGRISGLGRTDGAVSR